MAWLRSPMHINNRNWSLASYFVVQVLIEIDRWQIMQSIKLLLMHQNEWFFNCDWYQALTFVKSFFNLPHSIARFHCSILHTKWTNVINTCWSRASKWNVIIVFLQKFQLTCHSNNVTSDLSLLKLTKRLRNRKKNRIKNCPKPNENNDRLTQRTIKIKWNRRLRVDILS